MPGTELQLTMGHNQTLQAQSVAGCGTLWVTPHLLPPGLGLFRGSGPSMGREREMWALTITALGAWALG